MATIPDAVPEEALDYDAILRRGGVNCGDEDFALCKCPHCGCVYKLVYSLLADEPLSLEGTTAPTKAPISAG